MNAVDEKVTKFISCTDDEVRDIYWKQTIYSSNRSESIVEVLGHSSCSISMFSLLINIYGRFFKMIELSSRIWLSLVGQS